MRQDDILEMLRYLQRMTEAMESSAGANKQTLEVLKSHTQQERDRAKSKDALIRYAIQESWKRFEGWAMHKPTDLKKPKVKAYVEVTFGHELDWKELDYVAGQVFSGLRKVYPLPKKTPLPTNKDNSSEVDS